MVVLLSEITRNILITLSIMIGIVLIGIGIFLMFQKIFFKRNYRKKYYKKIYNLAELEDFYLINTMTIKNNEEVLCHLDHILFGNKYIYVIKDRCYLGQISGDYNDDVWIFEGSKKVRSEIMNPMKNNEIRIDRVSQASNIDSSLFISIVIVNNSCNIDNLTNLNNKNSFLVKEKNVKKLILAIENRNVPKFKADELDIAVKDFARLGGILGNGKTK